VSDYIERDGKIYIPEDCLVMANNSANLRLAEFAVARALLRECLSELDEGRLCECENPACKACRNWHFRQEVVARVKEALKP
jgi:hypothetical protein